MSEGNPLRCPWCEELPRVIEIENLRENYFSFQVRCHEERCGVTGPIFFASRDTEGARKEANDAAVRQWDRVVNEHSRLTAAETKLRRAHKEIERLNRALFDDHSYD